MADIELADFYQLHLQQQILPFWLQARDRQRGGIFTFFNNDGSKLISSNKYTWSQGRYLWIWATMVQMQRQGLLAKLAIGEQELLEDLDKTATFLQKYAFLDNGHCCYLVDGDGNKLEQYPGSGYDSSIFADCFVVMGLAEWARVSGDGNLLQKVLQLYRNIAERFTGPAVRSEPYPLPEGYQCLAFPMIQISTLNVLATAAIELASGDLHWLEQQQKLQLDQLLTKHFDHQGNSYEFSKDGDASSILARHSCPGHSGECLWMMLDAAKMLAVDIDARVLTIANRQWQLGWDQQYGGLLRYVDRDGGQPRGTPSSGSYQALIHRSWDYKLWWPHSEWLYLLLRLQQRQRYQILHDYVFKTFPSPTVGMEWRQICNRRGQAVDEVVALPVKDPFHIIRSILLILQLLQQPQQQPQEKMKCSN